MIKKRFLLLVLALSSCRHYEHLESHETVTVKPQYGKYGWTDQYGRYQQYSQTNSSSVNQSSKTKIYNNQVNQYNTFEDDPFAQTRKRNIEEERKQLERTRDEHQRYQRMTNEQKISFAQAERERRDAELKMQQAQSNMYEWERNEKLAKERSELTRRELEQRQLEQRVQSMQQQNRNVYSQRNVSQKTAHQDTQTDALPNEQLKEQKAEPLKSHMSTQPFNNKLRKHPAASPIQENVPATDPLLNQQMVEQKFEPLQSHASPQAFDNAPSNQSFAAPASNKQPVGIKNQNTSPSLYSDNTPNSRLPAQTKKEPLRNAMIDQQQHKPISAQSFAKETKPIPSLEEKGAMDNLNLNPIAGIPTN